MAEKVDATPDLLFPAPPWRWSERQALLRYWVKDPLEALGDLLPHHALRLLPTDRVSDFGVWLGRRAGRKRPVASARARALFAALRPAATEAELDAMLEAHWEHVGRCFAEFAAQYRFLPEGRITIEGREHLEKVRREGRPLIVTGLHVGSWEVLHMALSTLDIPFHGIYQRLPNRFRMRIAYAARLRGMRHGGKGHTIPIHPTLNAPFEALRVLESRNSALLYYIDEHWGGRVQAPALGRPLRMDGNIMRVVRLASRTGAAIVPGYALRIGNEARFRMTFLPPVTVGPPERGRKAILEDIALLDAAIDPVVRATPEQWLMAHVFQPDR